MKNIILTIVVLLLAQVNLCAAQMRLSFDVKEVGRIVAYLKKKGKDPVVVKDVSCDVHFSGGLIPPQGRSVLLNSGAQFEMKSGEEKRWIVFEGEDGSSKYSVVFRYEVDGRVREESFSGNFHN